eukprot:205573_1
MSASDLQLQEEKFSSWHTNCKFVSDTRRTTIQNYPGGDWAHNRTCYGTIQIPSNKLFIATWKIKIMSMGSPTYVCIGIDSIERTDKFFAGNKNAPNYGFGDDGKMYSSGIVKTKKQNYGSGDLIMMKLNTLSGVLEFYKNGFTEEALQHSFKIKKHPQIIYKLAISIKRAKVSIDAFDIKFANDESKQDEASADKRIEAGKNEFNKLQDKYNQLLQQMTEQKETISYQPNEKKEMDECMNIDYINRDLNLIMNNFKQRFNETKLMKIYKHNATDLVNKNSSLNVRIKSYENSIANIVKSLNSFNKCIQDTKSIVNNLSSPNKSEYKTWNVSTMIVWIGSLENGRYIKYLDVLENGFVKSEVTKGEYLIDLDASILSVEPFNISSFPDKRDLVKQFKTLNAQDIDVIEGNTIYQ